MKERVRQVEKERDEMSRAKDGIEAALKAEFERRLNHSLLIKSLGHSLTPDNHFG